MLEKLNGDWRLYHAEMKDGSKLRKYEISENQFYFVSFKDTKIKFSSSPLEARPNWINFDPYYFFLKTSDWAGYDIEKLTRDTLQLAENFKDSKDSELKRFFFLQETRYQSNIKKNYIGRDTLIASNNYTPKLFVNLERILAENFRGHITNFLIGGVIRLDLTTQKADVIIKVNNTKNQKLENKLTKIIQEKYAVWDLSEVKQFKIIDIPFNFYGKSVKNFTSVRMIFFSDESPYRKHNPIKSAEYFNIGISAYETGDLNKAVLYFEKAYAEDYKNINALFNKSLMYFGLGKKEEACYDWKKLAEMDHQQAEELYRINCN